MDREVTDAGGSGIRSRSDAAITDLNRVTLGAGLMKFRRGIPPGRGKKNRGERAKLRLFLDKILA